MCGCVSAEKTQYGKKKEKRDWYDSDKDVFFLKPSLSLCSHIYTHSPGRTFPDSKGQRALHCIALQNQEDQPARLIPSLGMID